MNVQTHAVTATNEREIQATKIELVLIQGDLSRLTPEEKVNYYHRVCDSLQLNPLTKPLDYLKLSGREVLYVKRDGTDQLRKIYDVSVRIVSRENIDGVFVVTAQASLPSGRVDESVGAVTVGGLKGDALANALMKCETKAKRRVTLSICGLGLLDETEIETIPEVDLPVQEGLATHEKLPFENLITNDQRKELFRMKEMAGWSDEAFKKLLETETGEASTKKLTYEQAEAMFFYLRDNPKKKDSSV